MSLTLVLLVPIWPPAALGIDETSLLLCADVTDVTANNEGWFIMVAASGRVMPALNYNV